MLIHRICRRRDGQRDPEDYGGDDDQPLAEIGWQRPGDELDQIVPDPLPSSTAAAMLAKLSSVRTIAAASLATSVPPNPMAIPISACFRAGVVTPSPVIATTSPRHLQRLDQAQLLPGSMGRR